MTSGSPVSRAAAMCWQKAGFLRVARALVVVIVEAGLADRHHFRMLGKRDQRLGIDVEFLVGIMRMRADRAENLRIFLGNRQHLRQLTHAGGDGDHAADAGRPRPPDHRVELGGEIGKIQVAVAIHQHDQGTPQ